MEAVRTSETSVDNYFIRQYVPEDNSALLSCFDALFSWCQSVCCIAYYIDQGLKTNCLWSHSIPTWEGGAISSNTTFEPYSLLPGQSSRVVSCPTSIIKFQTLPTLASQFKWFHSKCTSFWGDVNSPRWLYRPCHQWLIHWHFTLRAVHTPKPTIKVD
jgi:hypothetical protein